MTQENGKQIFLNWIRERCTKINEVEAKGAKHLESNDAEAYTALLRERAELISSMYNDATPFLANFPENEKSRISAELRRFSASAGQSLKMGSCFYMSALLYPEDHTPGQPHDLELWIEKTAKAL